MILETGRIITIETNRLQVETIQLSTCNSCQAKKGCGHNFLARYGAKASYLWVLLDGKNHSRYSIGDEVKISVPDNVIVGGSLFIYLLPLTTLIAATVIAHQQALGDGIVALSAFAGLLIGGAIVRLRSNHTRFDARLQPVLIDDSSSVRSKKDSPSTQQVIHTCSIE